MAQAILHLDDLPDAPLDAAARFHSEQVPIARDLLATGVDALAIVFPQDEMPHQAWQLAVVQSLAREAAPQRVNGVVGAATESIRAATDWLASADGITGQLLSLENG